VSWLQYALKIIPEDQEGSTIKEQVMKHKAFLDEIIFSHTHMKKKQYKEMWSTDFSK
jgi:hypothetical protein